MCPHHKLQDQGSGFWQPNIDWWAFANSHLNNSFIGVSNEWQAFIVRRVQEDLHLWQDLANAKTPQAFWTAFISFWQRAVEDYWTEYATFAKMSRTPLEDLTNGQPAREETSPRAKVA